MRIAYLDCFAGIAGDMFLGALIDAGVPAQVLHDATAALALGASLRIETVDRSGISCTKVHVLEGDQLAEKTSGATHSHAGNAAEPVPIVEQTAPNQIKHTHQPKTQHMHKTGHGHSHEHEHHDHTPHTHGRSLTQIRALIQQAALAEPVKQTAILAFELLGHSEAKIHNIPVDQIHFHEVGAVDAIVDIVAASAGIHHLNVDAWHCSAINVGGGMVECAHGTFPVPAPATADLLRGMPTYSAHIQKELVTPTGAALLRALQPAFGPQPAMRVEQIGYGAGSRNPKNFPNVLRLQLGQSADSTAIPTPLYVAPPIGAVEISVHQQAPASAHKHDSSRHHDSEAVVVLETALDDLSPQVIAYVAETALAKGALDVMLTPVIMKKGRPGTLLTVLCNPSDSRALEHLILRETSTLGVRIRQDRRSCLARSHVAVSTAYGEIRVKLGTLAEKTLNAAPEFEDCRAAAERNKVALKLVQQAAIVAFQSIKDQTAKP